MSVQDYLSYSYDYLYVLLCIKSCLYDFNDNNSILYHLPFNKKMYG